LIILDDPMDETDQTKTNYWFSKYNRVLPPYSVSIAAAAAMAAYIPVTVGGGGVYTSVSGAGGV
jgi:hypothetical protein